MKTSIEDILASHRTGRVVVMGILNVTPDSFSDGGAFLDPGAAREQAERMAAEGADVLDVGAESTRPGSGRVPAGEQIERLREVIPAVAACGVAVSIDTTRAEVACFALDSGAQLINDVSAGRDDARMLPLAAERGAPIVLMHMLDEPRTMQADPHYDDVVAEVRAFLAGRMDAAVAAGVPRERIVVDPGIGFGKRLEDNLALLAGVGELASLGAAVLVGPSRKRFIGALAGAPDPAERLGGSIAACLAAYRRGATIFRVHDVAPVRQALTVAAAIEGPREQRSV
ncbi:MAG TPA: dihydropteroate synthase [Phycisphaerae bacterium]|nr:dihydropteroate synthase [Phycisphaerae bacterium]